MNTEPSHLSRTLLPFATMLLSVCIAPSARADRAENAFVTVRAVGAGVTRVDGRNFSANEDGEVEIEAQPGWTLLTPSRVRVTKGQSPHYQVRSSGGEQTGGGDIWRTVTERVRVHVQDPALTAALDAGGPYVYAAPSNGVWVAVSGSATGTPGLHVWEVRTTVYKNGEVVDTSAEIEPGDPFPLELDRWKWTWSPGAPGETNVQSFVSEPVLLPKGTYTASGTAEAWNSQCPDCHASKPASEPFVVSLLTISCNPWIGQDRTGDPAASYTSPKVTATASLEPENPDVKKVTWGGVNKCEKRDPQDWSITLWTEDREKASDTYLGERVTASVAGATATTNFTIVKVDVTIDDGLSHEQGPSVFAFGGQAHNTAPRYGSVAFAVWPCDLPEEKRFFATSSSSGDLICEDDPEDPFSANGYSEGLTASELSSKTFLVDPLHVSEGVGDQIISLEDSVSGAKDEDCYTVYKLICHPCDESGNILDEERTRYGVGESMILTVSPEPTDCFFSCDNVDDDDAGMFGQDLFIHPSRDSTPLIFAEVDGELQLKVETKTVEPSLVIGMVKSRNQLHEYVDWSNNAAWAFMEFDLWVLPSDVSFANVLFKEEDCDSLDPEGYFVEHPHWRSRPLVHNANTSWTSVSRFPQNKALGIDHAGSGVCPPFDSTGKWSNGSFSFDIPSKWKVASWGSPKPFPEKTKQTTSILENGKVTVGKFDATASRFPGD